MTREQILKKYFGYDEFRPMQGEVIDEILSGKDVLAIMPTGAGKSLCFQVPALMFPYGSVIISPLISLMKDQVEALNEQGISASYVNSTVTYEESIERLRELYRGHIKLLYMAPEKLEASYFTHCLSQVPISMVVVDEAHCVSQWGHDFRPSYRKIRNFINTLSKKPIIAAFTATATQAVEKDMRESLGLSDARLFKTSLDRPNLSFTVITDTDKYSFLSKYISAHKEESGIIYCATRKAVDEVYEYVKAQGYSVGKYHAGMDDDGRRKAQEDFSFDRIQIMVATNAFGMGIDKSNIRYIIHYQMPKSLEAYYQEAGRGGRDGDDAECILLYSGRDSGIQKFLIEQSFGDEDRKKKDYRRLHAMIDYCKTGECLRNFILKYFGEKPKENCGHCSRCLTECAKADVTDIAVLAFRTIKIVNEHFGMSVIADILKGSRSKSVIERKLDKVPTYGRLSFESAKHIKSMLARYMADGYLRREGEPYPVLKLTEKAQEVLDGTRKVMSIASAASDVIEDTITEKKVKIKNKGAFFEILRKLRREIASEEKVPPFVIFSDATLTDMLIKMPTTEDELAKVKGVGAFKLKKYGKRFIELLKSVKDKKVKTDEEKSSENLRNDSKERKITTRQNKYEISAKLLKLRKNISEKENIKPHLIFSDKILEKIAEKAPKTLDELSAIKGIGPRKIEKYGKIFLKEIELVGNIENTEFSETDKQAFLLYMTKVLERIGRKIHVKKELYRIDEDLIKCFYSDENPEKYLNDEQRKHKEEIIRAIDAYRNIVNMRVRK